MGILLYHCTLEPSYETPYSFRFPKSEPRAAPGDGGTNILPTFFRPTPILIILVYEPVNAGQKKAQGKKGDCSPLSLAICLVRGSLHA